MADADVHDDDEGESQVSTERNVLVGQGKRGPVDGAEFALSEMGEDRDLRSVRG